MAIYTEIKGEEPDQELYVYMNGKLLYKRWLRTGASALFTLKPNWTYRKGDSIVSITDEGKKKNY